MFVSTRDGFALHPWRASLLGFPSDSVPTSTSRSRSVRRHLLALCTFLVPLGALAWLQQAELRRQDSQVRGALQREASQFLVGAASEIDHLFDRELASLAQQASEGVGAEMVERGVRGVTLARATLSLRATTPTVEDLVLLDQRGALIAPEPASGRNLPTFARDAEQREFGARDSGPQNSLRCAELMIDCGELATAEAVLRDAIAKATQNSGRFRRSFGEGSEVEMRMQFRLATVLLRTGKNEEGMAWLQRIRDQVEASRELSRRGPDTESGGMGLLAETLLAEHDPSLEARLALLAAIANGRRDAADETTQRMVADRLASGIPAKVSERTVADALLNDVDAHLQAREFASDYESYLDESVRLLLHNRTEAVGSAELKRTSKVFSLEGRSSLLLLHPLFSVSGASSGWLGIRVDLRRMLANCLDGYIRGNGRFVLAIADSDNLSVIESPSVPTGFDPPSMLSHTLQLRAYPADVEGWLHEANAAARNATVLAIGLLLVAGIGAFLLWRSVTRESELATMKVDLVSRVSHELKTPLALISLYGETLGMKRARDTDQAAEFGRIITRESGRLTTLIERILDFSRQQSGTLRYEPTRLELGPLLDETASAYRLHLETKGFFLDTELQPDVFVRVDPKALAGAIVNLLDNAVKYAVDEPQEEPLQLVMRAQGGVATIELQDRGRGVPVAESERVFESFYRASNAGEVRGAGLGLSIVRHFAAAHGGTATVAPRPGGGSIFRITLPTIS